MIMNTITFWRAYEQLVARVRSQLYAVVMPKIAGRKRTAKARAATLSTIGGSGRTDGEKAYSTSGNASKHCMNKKRIE